MSCIRAICGAGLVALVVVVVLVVAAVAAVLGLAGIRHRLAYAEPVWLVIAAVAQLAAALSMSHCFAACSLGACGGA